MALAEALTNEQLCALAQSGDVQARERLIENNRPFVQWVANQIIIGDCRNEQLSSCGITMDDLLQVGDIGLWRAIDSYDLSSKNEFLTYAASAIRRKMLDLIEQYSRDTVWRLRTNQVQPRQIVYLDESLDETGEDTVESLIASPYAKSPEQICIEQENVVELHKAMDVLSHREDVYIRYRFGFTDDTHSLVDTASHFHLSESRAKGVERSALKLLKHELLVEIPERTFVKAENQLTKILVAEGELHSIELRLKSQKKRGRKITAAVYEYLADCDGKLGELSYNFKDDTAEILLLAEWDTMVSHRFAFRAIEYLREHSRDALPEKIVLTFIGSEQWESDSRTVNDTKLQLKHSIIQSRAVMLLITS